MAKMKITKTGRPKNEQEPEDPDVDVEEEETDAMRESLQKECEDVSLERSARKRKKPARFLDGMEDGESTEAQPEKSGESPNAKRGRSGPKPVIIVVRNKPKKESSRVTIEKASAFDGDNDAKDAEEGTSNKNSQVKKSLYPRLCADCSETYEDKKAWDDHISIWKCGIEQCPYCKLEMLKSLLDKHMKNEHKLDIVQVIEMTHPKGGVQREPGVFEPSQPEDGKVKAETAATPRVKTSEELALEQREEICPFCALTMSKIDLDVHIQTEHAEYACDEEMDYYFEQAETEQYEEADERRDQKRRYSGKWRRELTSCPECGIEIMKGALYKHMRQKHEEVTVKRGRKPVVTYPRTCLDCNEVFDERPAYERHRIKVHTPRKPPEFVVCEHCGRTYTKASLWKHIESIHPEQAADSPLRPKATRLPPFPRTCDQCEHVCEDSRAWDAHRAKHRPKKLLGPLEQRLVPCPHCAKQMVRSSVDRHIRLVHPELAPIKPPLIGAKRGPKVRISWPRACPDCKQLFDNKIRYDRHRSDGVCGAIPIQFRKNQICSYCAQRFRRSEIGRHIKLVHCDQLPPEQRIEYPCRYPNCHKIYHKPSSRYSHELTHREEGHNRILQKRKEYRLNKKFLEKTLGFEGIEVQINEGDFRDENGNPTGAFTVTLEEVEDLAASKSIENIGLQTMAAIASHLEPSYEHTTEGVEQPVESETRIIQVPEGDARIIQVPDGDARIIQVPDSDAKIIELPEGNARIVQLASGEYVQYGIQEGDVQYIQEVDGELQLAEAEDESDERVIGVLEAQEDAGEVQQAMPEEEAQDDEDKSMTLNQKPTTLKMMNCRLCNLYFPDSKNLMEHFIKTHTDLMQEVTLTGFELVN